MKRITSNTSYHTHGYCNLCVAVPCSIPHGTHWMIQNCVHAPGHLSVSIPCARTCCFTTHNDAHLLFDSKLMMLSVEHLAQVALMFRMGLRKHRHTHTYGQSKNTITACTRMLGRRHVSGPATTICLAAGILSTAKLIAVLVEPCP